ncbi:MAG: D-Ala-D-Ala carboxypeptidase family metallohydrolase [Anaeromicrobium sp.]|jgi:uncharacterized protein YcbK (DUF882 family)|uniref:YcbK family protein n=1 Tax=Anaeromicrobium sp. TaxID=1929132 RepID=UPI0025D60F56|nr:D-Ala-D-Ala carboxypeptidase family metallohydrolase [Anaeromicrobium sp.]MCT4593599.1 D-Ala-D-Ala carboxypeptidase family metallohydrolase [Anaeromicrobium sp.]
MYKVVKNIKLSKNFSISEFVCKEGKKEVLCDYKLIEKLQKLRDKINKPITINSGYRSKTYNKKVGGSPKSQHLLGKAADIVTKGIDKEKIKEIAIELGFTGIGLYDIFVHLDVRNNPHPRGYSFWDNRTKR